MYDKSNPPYGLVGYSRSKGLFSWLQYQFAGPGASHAFLITYPIGKYTETPMVFEADMTVTHTPYEHYLYNGPSRDYYLYAVPELSDEEITYALDRCTNEFSGVRYGFTQLLWFPYRWFVEKILRKDVRKTKNWFTEGVICTELWWYFLWYATERWPDKHMKLRSILSQWNPDTIQAYDVKIIMQKNKDIFVPFGFYQSGVWYQEMEI
jgi:hypothetical protein